VSRWRAGARLRDVADRGLGALLRAREVGHLLEGRRAADQAVRVRAAQVNLLACPPRHKARSRAARSGYALATGRYRTSHAETVSKETARTIASYRCLRCLLALHRLCMGWLGARQGGNVSSTAAAGPAPLAA